MAMADGKDVEEKLISALLQVNLSKGESDKMKELIRSGDPKVLAFSKIIGQQGWESQFVSEARIILDGNDAKIPGRVKRALSKGLTIAVPAQLAVSPPPKENEIAKQKRLAQMKRRSMPDSSELVAFQNVQLQEAS